MGKTKKPTAEVRELDIGQSILAPLNRLAVSVHNVRKTDINDLSGLKASILEHGLLEALVGYKVDAEASEKIELDAVIAAGQRRLLSLQQLAAEGLIAADAPVPVRLVDQVTAIEVSLAENIERKAMNPADETCAFKALVDTGTHNAESIARRFGFDVRLVRRRLKMAVLAPEILDALRNGDITVNSAEAYAATDDHALQLKIFKEHSAKNYYSVRHDPKTILRSILNAGIDVDTPVGKFIGGAKAYKQAGGTLERDDAFGDLFASVMYGGEEDKGSMTDMALVETLFNAKVAGAAKKAEKAALEAYPFITGVEWCVLGGGGQLQIPKPPKGMVRAERFDDWMKDIHIESAQVPKLAKKAAEKEGATVLALITLDSDGKPKVMENLFLVGKDAWDKVKPKPKKRDEPARPQLTEEERAALDRQRRLNTWKGLIFGRSLLGETPGFQIAGATVDRSGRLVLDVRSTEPLDEALIAKDQWGNPSLNYDAMPEEVATIAEERMAAEEKEREIAEREAAAKRKEAEAAEAAAMATFNDAYNLMLDETVPPEVVVLTDADPDNPDFRIEFVNMGEGWTWEDDDGEEETIDGFDVVADLVSQFAEHRASRPVLTTYATFGEFEAAAVASGDIDQADAEVLADAPATEDA